MKIHEYQAKEILRTFGVGTPRGIACFSLPEALEAGRQLGGPVWVVKAQIHAGGRGKGGGVKVAKSLEEVEQYARQILGMQLVTPQTGPEGKEVRKILVEEGEHTREFYMSVLLNRAIGRNMIMYSPRGGMDIEAVAEETPDQIFTEEIDPRTGLIPSRPGE